MLSQSTNFGIWAGYILIHYHSRQLFHVGIWKTLTNTLKYEKNGSVMVTEAVLRPKYELLQFLVVSASSTTFFRDVPLNHTRSRRSKPFSSPERNLEVCRKIRFLVFVVGQRSDTRNEFHKETERLEAAEYFEESRIIVKTRYAIASSISKVALTGAVGMLKQRVLYLQYSVQSFDQPAS